MNDINELIEIIQSLGGNATTNGIVREYCRIHHMVEQPHFNSVVEKTLSANRNKVRYNRAKYMWEYNAKDKVEYIFVSDNRFFASIREAMLYIFNKSVPLSQGYFQVDDDHMAWFPQPKNDNWENVLSDDGRFWFEKPKTADADYEADNKLRYVFIHEKKGYRFTGLFKVRDITDDKTRIYELVDDKVARTLTTTTNKKKNAQNSPDNLANDMKIGEFVRYSMRELADSGFTFSPQQIEEMTTLEWSKKHLNLNCPFMKRYIPNKTDNKGTDGYVRFWNEPFSFGNQQVLISKEWYEKQRKGFIEWYSSLTKS